MRYAGIKENDTINGEGVCVSLFLQGCPHRCRGCFNPETWDFNGGIEIEEDELLRKIHSLIINNGITRNFSILGGEPLCKENCHFTALAIAMVKTFFPESKIFVWTGYTLEELIEKNSCIINIILGDIDVLIDGRYIEEKRDITLKWRGSKNQRILTKEKIRDIISHKGE